MNLRLSLQLTRLTPFTKQAQGNAYNVVRPPAPKSLTVTPASAATPPPPTRAPAPHNSSPLGQLPTFTTPGGPLNLPLSGNRAWAGPPNNGLPQFQGTSWLPQAANFATQMGWNMMFPQQIKPLGKNPMDGRSMTSYVPAQYRNADAAAQYALQTFKPYQNGLTGPAQMLQRAIPGLQQATAGMDSYMPGWQDMLARIQQS